METTKKEGVIIDHRRFTLEGDINSENVRPESEQEPQKVVTQESFEKQGVVLELLRRIDGIAESIAKLNTDLAKTSKEFDALYNSLPPEEQKTIKERLKIDSTELGKDLIGFVAGKKKEEHHPARPSQIGFVKK